MDFAKTYSPNKKVVDDAVKFAVSKDVLLVHAAGNDNLDLNHNDSFPNPVYEGNNGFAATWIEVGASGLKDDQNLKAAFLIQDKRIRGEVSRGSSSKFKS